MERNFIFRDFLLLLFLNSLFESIVNDVIDMTHQKFFLDQKLQIQKFIKPFRKNDLTPICRLYSHSKKNTVFSQNFKMPMLSLIENKIWWNLHKVCKRFHHAYLDCKNVFLQALEILRKSLNDLMKFMSLMLGWFDFFFCKNIFL